MANPEIQNLDPNGILLGDVEYLSADILTNQVLLVGSVMGIILIAIGAVTAHMTTGNGTLTQWALESDDQLAKIGTYVVTCIEAITNGGDFKIVDPDGMTIGTQLITAGAGGTGIWSGGGVSFVITDGGTDFAVGDYWDCVVGAGSLKLLLAVSTAADGSKLPKYVLDRAIDTSASGLNATTETRVVKAGKLRENRLAFGGSDDIDTVINGQTIKEHLRDYGIFTEPLQSQVKAYDNA